MLIGEGGSASLVKLGERFVLSWIRHNEPRRSFIEPSAPKAAWVNRHLEGQSVRRMHVQLPEPGRPGSVRPACALNPLELTVLSFSTVLALAPPKGLLTRLLDRG